MVQFSRRYAERQANMFVVCPTTPAQVFHALPPADEQASFFQATLRQQLSLSSMQACPPLPYPQPVSAQHCRGVTPLLIIAQAFCEAVGAADPQVPAAPSTLPPQLWSTSVWGTFFNRVIDDGKVRILCMRLTHSTLQPALHIDIDV